MIETWDKCQPDQPNQADQLTVESLWGSVFENDIVTLACHKDEAEKIIQDLSKYKYAMRVSAPELGLDGLRIKTHKGEPDENGQLILTIRLEEMTTKKAVPIKAKLIKVENYEAEYGTE